MPKVVILMLSFSAMAVGDVLAQVDIQNPTTARDFYERGLEREDAEDFAEALANYQIAGLLDPQFFDAHFSLSSLCAKTKDYRGAIAALTASLKARPKDYSACLRSQSGIDCWRN